MRDHLLTPALGTALVLGLLAGGCALQRAGTDAEPDHPVGRTAAGEPTAPSRPDPTYTHSEFPSGLVVRLPEGDVDLPADTSCWTDPHHCRRALLPLGAQLPEVGSRDTVDFWFARPGWTFRAVLRREGDACPRATTVKARPTDDQWFRLSPAGHAGTQEVELFGQGPEGAVSSRFLWTTTSEGPLDPPKGSVSLAPESRGPGSYGLEVTIDDLAFQPTRSDLTRPVAVTVTSAEGRETRLAAPVIAPSLDCGARGSRGSFYYQREWLEDLSVLGQAPYELEVALPIRGTTYVGTATWRAGRGRPPYTPLTFDPPLPGAVVD